MLSWFSCPVSVGVLFEHGFAFARLGSSTANVQVVVL